MKPQVAIVTGASSGIGQATAEALAGRGMAVVLAARSADRLSALARSIEQSGGRALAVPTDVTQQDQLQRLVDQTLQHFSRIDVLVNNAGLGYFDWVDNLRPDELRTTFEVNVLGLIALTRLVFPVMQQQRSGHVVNIGSMAGVLAPPALSVYSASKFAVTGFTEALRREGVACGVHVSLVCPGGVHTPFADHICQERVGFRKIDTLFCTPPEHVARAVVGLVRWPRRCAVVPGYMRFALLFNALAPGLIDRVLGWWVARQRRPGK